MAEALAFLTACRAGDLAAVQAWCARDPSIARRQGISSVVCGEGGGVFAMPVYQWLCNWLRDGVLSDVPNLKEICACIGRQCNNAPANYLLAHLGLNGRWLDLVQEALATGVAIQPDPRDDALFGAEIAAYIRTHAHV